jgi:cysteine synthase A
MIQRAANWTQWAVQKIISENNRSADTHLIKLELPSISHIDLYLKDESTHPTGSLKHRLARSLFLYGLCNGWIKEGTTIVESSSGSTAISEAYFARLLGLPFIAVVPKSTSREKLEKIEYYGGRCHLVAGQDIYSEAIALARDTQGHYMDQFTYAERATDWRGNNNIAESIFRQMAEEPHPLPEWVVTGAGTGGTSATIGRFIRYSQHPERITKVCVVDPENSVFFDYFHGAQASITSNQSSAIEGIGRPRVEASFIPQVVDRMIRVPDAASIAAIHFLKQKTGLYCGASTGTGLWGAFQLIAEMQQNDQCGSVVMILCDSGERYSDTYYNDTWLRAKGFDLSRHTQTLDRFYRSGQWDIADPDKTGAN